MKSKVRSVTVFGPFDTRLKQCRFVIDGVVFWLDFADMQVGSGVFLPTTATVEDVAEEIRFAVNYYKYAVKVSTHKRDGQVGVLLHRIS